MRTMAKKKPKPVPTPAPVTDWPQRLRDLRARLKLTQAEAAARVEAHLRAWQWWEAGKFKPNKFYQAAIRRLEESQE